VDKADFVVITWKEEEDLLGSSKIKPLPLSLQTWILQREVSGMNRFLHKSSFLSIERATYTELVANHWIKYTHYDFSHYSDKNQESWVIF